MDNKEELLNQQLEELKDCYRQELPQRLAEVKSLWQQATAAWSARPLTELCTSLHRISGSAGSFGYRELSAFAAKAELLLKPYSKTGNAPDNNELDILNTAIEQVVRYEY
ncbi:Hpt domain-containing protein [Thalassomonas viridans]|uniref:Hpt domain-containing protein n=1 Tax=Thalassomonas viridans TaxID=137584 RepID=A0AAE9Z4W9_9GAMM|nr:Hpt domain-containing protein [Thalassomonas viridans]WDE06114.1 Hpt domain-containing protein [Thalassomonas viridans]